MNMQRESMEFDVLIVGGGPAGLSTAIKIKQLAAEMQKDISVCLLEKGSEIGAHILSGALLETRALDELLPHWKSMGAPVTTAVTKDQTLLLNSAQTSWSVPNMIVPKSMHNEGNYIISLGKLCAWLGEYAESLEVDIFPGFAAAEIIYHDDGRVKGVITGDMGVDKAGKEKDGFTPGIELQAQYTVFSEGCRGHLGKQLIAQFELDKDSQPQHYGIGIKELWKIPKEQHELGTVVHGAGWPLKENGASGGFFLYHAEDEHISIGLITDLNYQNPHISPFNEFQRLKHHPEIAKILKGGERVSYGARAIAKGGLQSLPKMTMPGALLIGCDAGTLNTAKIKGTHTAMKSGILAAEAIVSGLAKDQIPHELTEFDSLFKDSWLYEELNSYRNFSAALHKWGTFFGGAFNTVEQWLFPKNSPVTLKDEHADHLQLKNASQFPAITYDKPDNVLSFDRLSSVFLANVYHEEDQPCHLQLSNNGIPIEVNLPLYGAPEQHYCPAGVYEIVIEEEQPRLQINAQNCVHCKTCDIKDPRQNIQWVTPEGTGGPNYQAM